MQLVKRRLLKRRKSYLYQHYKTITKPSATIFGRNVSSVFYPFAFVTGEEKYKPKGGGNDLLVVGRNATHEQEDACKCFHLCYARGFAIKEVNML